MYKKVRLLKSYVMFTGKKLPMGQIYGAEPQEMERLINEGIAIPHYGDERVLLREHKMKTNFFKPKN